MWERVAREGNVRRPQLRSCTRKSREGLPAAMAKRSAAVAGRLKSPRLPRGSVQWGCIRRTGAALGKAIARVGPPDTTFFIFSGRCLVAESRLEKQSSVQRHGSRRKVKKSHEHF